MMVERRCTARTLVLACFAALCLLAPGIPAQARPPAQPGGPVAPSRGQLHSSSGLAFALIPWTAYAAAAAVIFAAGRFSRWPRFDTIRRRGAN